MMPTPQNRATRKIFYDEPYRSACRARIVEVRADYLTLDQTVMYPLGGGQEADSGIITCSNGCMLQVIDVKKTHGSKVFIPALPDVVSDGVIQHYIAPAEISFLKDLSAGDEVRVELNVERRAWLSLSHTASHLAFVGVREVRPEAAQWTLGCHIGVKSARFDFGVEDRFTSVELGRMEEIANNLVKKDCRIHLSEHPGAPDMRYWNCENHIMPCGGTHLASTGAIGRIILKRKNIGAGKERLICEFPEASIDLHAYYVEKQRI